MPSRISMPFSSPTVEALTSYNRSYYADLNNTFPNSFFNRFDNLVANSEKEALRLFDYWLNLEEDKFSEYIDKNIKHVFGKNKMTNTSKFIRDEI